MASNPEKRKAADSPVSPPPAKRPSLEPDASTQRQTHLKLPSPPRRTRRDPRPQASPFTVPTSNPASLIESETEASLLLNRIRSGIAYTKQQHARGQAVQQTTRFIIDTTSASSLEALSLLRRHGTLIASSPRYELFELGIPRPDRAVEGAAWGIHDAQWWVGKTAAEIKAGPYAEESDVKKMEANLRGLETKRKKRKGPSGRERETEWKLTEGLERQRHKDGLQDEEGEEMESGVDRSTNVA